MKTKITTYFVTDFSKSNLMYSAESWVQVRLLLETAGPVAVSTDEEILPVLSGKGRLLPTGDEIRFFLPPGNRLFIAANSIQRVAVTVEPLPFLYEILGTTERGVSAIVGSIRGLAGALSRRGGAPSRRPPQAVSGVLVDDDDPFFMVPKGGREK